MFDKICRKHKIISHLSPVSVALFHSNLMHNQLNFLRRLRSLQSYWNDENQTPIMCKNNYQGAEYLKSSFAKTDDSIN